MPGPVHLSGPESFLGMYFSIYVMGIGTGVQSGSNAIDPKVSLTAPLSNFGVVAQFRMKKWVHITGNIGFFSLYTSEFGGAIYDLNASLLFKPTKWPGFTPSYQEFDINVFFKEKEVDTTVDYNFRGPASWFDGKFLIEINAGRAPPFCYPVYPGIPVYRTGQPVCHQIPAIKSCNIIITFNPEN